jgi:hypothetical protein
LFLDRLKFVFQLDALHRSSVFLFYNVLDVFILVTSFCQFVLEFLKAFLTRSKRFDGHEDGGFVSGGRGSGDLKGRGSGLGDLQLSFRNDFSTSLVFSFSP